MEIAIVLTVAIGWPILGVVMAAVIGRILWQKEETSTQQSDRYLFTGLAGLLAPLSLLLFVGGLIFVFVWNWTNFLICYYDNENV